MKNYDLIKVCVFLWVLEPDFDCKIEIYISMNE